MYGKTPVTVLQRFWSGVKKHPFQYDPKTMSPLSHLICETCTIVPLAVDHDGIDGEHGCKRSALIRCTRQESPVGEVDLNAKWREAQGPVLDFVEIGEGDWTCTFLVEWRDGIAFRVQRPVEGGSWAKFSDGTRHRVP